MPEMPDDSVIYPLATELSQCLCAELGDASPCFCGVIVGEDIPVEYAGDCEDCGAAYVRVTQAFPSTTAFPAPDEQGRCGSLIAFILSVGVVRCVPVGDNAGNPPTPEEMAEVARQALADQAAIRRAITCCFGEKYEDAQYVLGTMTPLPNTGGVMGVEWDVTVQEPF